MRVVLQVLHVVYIKDLASVAFAVISDMSILQICALEGFKVKPCSKSQCACFVLVKLTQRCGFGGGFTSHYLQQNPPGQL